MADTVRALADELVTTSLTAHPLQAHALGVSVDPTRLDDFSTEADAEYRARHADIAARARARHRRAGRHVRSVRFPRRRAG